MNPWIPISALALGMMLIPVAGGVRECPVILDSTL
jgi:hypothetical protein